MKCSRSIVAASTTTDSVTLLVCFVIFFKPAKSLGSLCGHATSLRLVKTPSCCSCDATLESKSTLNHHAGHGCSKTMLCSNTSSIVARPQRAKIYLHPQAFLFHSDTKLLFNSDASLIDGTSCSIETLILFDSMYGTTKVHWKLAVMSFFKASWLK